MGPFPGVLEKIDQKIVNRHKLRQMKDKFNIKHTSYLSYNVKISNLYTS